MSRELLGVGGGLLLGGVGCVLLLLGDQLQGGKGRVGETWDKVVEEGPRTPL